MTIIGDNYGEIDTETGEHRFYWECKLCGRKLTDDELEVGEICDGCRIELGAIIQ